MPYNGKQTTIAGTFVKSAVIMPQPEAGYSVSKVLITTNERPNKQIDNNFLGWFKSADDVLEYFSKESKVYKMVKTFFNQQNWSNPNLNNAFIGVSYVNITDATNAYIVTQDMESRLQNFQPEQGSFSFIGKTLIKSGSSDVAVTGKIELTKKPKDLEELATFLNRMAGQAYFEVIEVNGKKEFKISTLYNGSKGIIGFEPLGDINEIDIAGENYLNVLEASVVAGTDSVNNEEDYFKSLLINLSTNYGINPRTLMTTVNLSVTDKVNINNELGELFNDLNENKCSKLCSHLNCKDEVNEFTSNFNTQPLYVTTRTANWNENSSKMLDASYCAALVSQDIKNSTRFDPEWNTINIDNSYYFNQKGYDNKESNDICENSYTDLVQYNGEGVGLVVRGSKKGWSVAMHSAYLQIINYIPMIIYNFMAGQKDKRKSSEKIAIIIMLLNNFGEKIFNNGYLSNEPLEEDTTMQSLSKKRQEEIRKIGWSVFIKRSSEIKGQEIPYDIALCLGGIMASYSGTYNIMQNF